MVQHEKDIQCAGCEDILPPEPNECEYCYQLILCNLCAWCNECDSALHHASTIPSRY